MKGVASTDRAVPSSVRQGWENGREEQWNENIVYMWYTMERARRLSYISGIDKEIGLFPPSWQKVCVYTFVPRTNLSDISLTWKSIAYARINFVLLYHFGSLKRKMISIP